MGYVKVGRAYYYDPVSGKGLCPKDATLGIEGTSMSPGVKRIASRVGAYRPFGPGHDDIRELAGISVTAKEVERISREIGDDAARFFAKESDEALSVPDPASPQVPVMYVSMDGEVL